MKKFFQVLGIVTLLLVGLYYIEECSKMLFLYFYSHIPTILSNFATIYPSV